MIPCEINRSYSKIRIIPDVPPINDPNERIFARWKLDDCLLCIAYAAAIPAKNGEYQFVAKFGLIIVNMMLRNITIPSAIAVLTFLRPIFDIYMTPLPNEKDKHKMLV